MLGALIVVFREVFEAGLIVGIMLAVTRNVPHHDRWIVGGIAAGIAGACAVAVFAGSLSSLFAGMGQELFNAAILGIAVVMLTWHNVWMAQHGKDMADELRAKGQAVADGSRSLIALAVVVGVAVLREGSEVVLFLYGIATADGGPTIDLAAGGLIGLFLGAVVCVLTYKGLVRIPSKALFSVTTGLITLLAAGMAAQATSFLERANWVTILDSMAWDTSWLVPDGSLLGRTLHVLIGYTDRPSVIEVIVYASMIAITITLMRGADRSRSVRSAHK